jgi:hypothetical protein
MRRKLRSIYRLLGSKILGACPGYPIHKPIDTCQVEILADPEFQKSCKEVSKHTVLDTPRLANLWSLCRLTNPEGNIVEVGSYRGGGAMHLSNACPKRKIIVCDSFQGFEELDQVIDSSFTYDMFKNTTYQAVNQRFAGKNRDYAILAGFFPASCRANNVDISPVSFVHLDVDAYKPTIESLEYLQPRMLDRSLIVMDDFNRGVEGVIRAVGEFTEKNPSWQSFPLFPSQGLLVHQSWFQKVLPPHHELSRL